MERPLQALIYVRVSTDKQAEVGISLDNQERAALDWAFRNKVKVLKVFSDEGASAKTLKRPEIQNMIKYISDNSKDIDYVIVYQIDRVSRNLSDFVDFVKFLSEHSIELRDANSHIESNESDEFIQNISAAIAQYDNKQKSKRVKDNMRRHAAEGYRLHKAPYGLKNIKDDDKHPKVIVADQEVIDKITLVLTEFSKGIMTRGELVQESRKIG
ncbi:MAG TPA: recombinase family protein, partial [Candidatus Saccharimonadales bacterium]